MSMQSWERDIIEYRPDIQQKTNILSIIQQQLKQQGLIYKPTEVVKELMKNKASSMIEQLLEDLKTGTALLKEIEQELSNYDRFHNYQTAKVNDDIYTAKEIHFDNILDINGHPSFDIYPILADLMEELDVFIDYVIDELFNRDELLNDSNSEVYNRNQLENIINKEQEFIDSIILTESKDLRFEQTPQFTEQQRALIQRIIDDPDNEINSVKDYIHYLRNERLKIGSPNINYDYLADRIQTIAVLSNKANFYHNSINEMSRYVNTTLPNYVHNDVQGSLEYVTSMSYALSDIKESCEIAHRAYAMNVIETIKNMHRVGDAEFRKYIDKQLSDIRQKKRQLVDGLRYSLQINKIYHEGAYGVKASAMEGIRSVNNLWKFVLTEHYGNSELNLDQQNQLTSVLNDKKKHQVMYHYIDLVQREFDFEHRDKELKVFAEREHLYYRTFW